MLELIKKKQNAQRSGARKRLAILAKELGDAYVNAGRPEEALQEYYEQLEICDGLRDKLNGALAHRLIGEVYTDQGDYQQALLHLDQYLERATELEDLKELQRAHATLGRLYYVQGLSLPSQSEERDKALRSARKAYSKSVQLCEKLNDTNIELKELMTMRTRLLYNFGLVYEHQEDTDGAMELFEKAAGLSESHKLWEELQKTQNALGELWDKRGKYELALEHYERATKGEDPILRAEAQLALVNFYLRNERWSEARKILVSLYARNGLPENLDRQVKKSLRIAVTIQDCSRSLSTEASAAARLDLYEKLGDAAAAAELLSKSVDYYKGMLSCAEETKSDRVGPALVSLARTLKDAGRFTEACVYARREFALSAEPREVSKSALFLADILIASSSPEEEVSRYFDVAGENAAKLSDPSLQKSVLEDRSLYLRKIGRVEEADVIDEEIERLREVAGSESESEKSEVEDVGADISLDELSDVERERRGSSKHVVRANSRRDTSSRRTRGGIKRNEKGETQLHVACINGDVGSVGRLLDSGHPVNVRDHCGWTPLHEASNHGHDEVVKLLLQHGANANDSGGSLCNGITPLHDAASCGNFSTMQILMEHGANSTLLTTDGHSVLDFLDEWKERVGDDIPDLRDYENVRDQLARTQPSTSSKHTRVSTESSRTDTKKARSRRFVVSDDESNEGDEADQENLESVSAREYYKRAIDGLKHRYDPIGKPKQTTEFAPLVDSEQVLVEDWLEDDVGPVRKPEGPSTSTFKRKSAEVDGNTEPRRAKRSANQITSDDDDYDGQESETVSLPEERREYNTSGTRTPTKLSVSITEERRERNASKPRTPAKALAHLTEELRELNTSGERSPAKVSAFPRKRQKHTPCSLKLNVYVEGKVFEVELESVQNVEDLVSSITTSIEKRFEGETGCKGKFSLTETSLATLASEIANGNSEVNLKCETIKLEVPPIAERYASICRARNTGVRNSVSKSLKCCENTYTYRLKSDEIDEEELACLFKTLEYQKDVQTLDFSGADFSAIGSPLNDCMSKLPLLQELQLQSCDIDSKGLSKLEALPRQLKLLDLSYNPLDTESQQVLWKLLTPLKLLHTLNLRYCGLTDFQTSVLNDEILHLDVSWNNFSASVAGRILQRQLLSLNLSNAFSSGRFDSPFADSRNTCFVSFESLDLASCDLSDADVGIISSCMLNLSKLVLANNRGLTVSSSEVLLRRKPTLTYVDVSGCATIAKRPENDVFIDHPGNCTFLATMLPEISEFWIELWRGKGTVRKLPQNLAVFKPI